MRKCFYPKSQNNAACQLATHVLRAGLVVMLSAMFSSSAISQTSDVHVRGTVYESGTSTPLARARVSITRVVGTGLRTTRVLTNSLGQYALNATAPVSVDEVEVPDRDGYWVEPAYPNPFRAGSGTLRLRYGTPGGDDEQAAFEMFDVLGRRVDSYRSLSAGVYFYRIRFSDGLSMARSIVVVGSGPLSVQLSHEREAAQSSASDVGTSWFGKTAAEAEFLVEKDGFVTVSRTLTLSDDATDVVDFELDVAETPTADFSVSGAQVAGQPTLFDASASSGPPGEELFYTWEFGDGIHGGNVTVAHVYGRAGMFAARLTVRTQNGATASVSKSVVVGQGTPATGTGGVIEVLVREPTGNPLQGVTVRSEDPSRTVLTDAFGKATLSNLALGIPVRLSFTKQGFTDQFARVDIPSSPTNPTRIEAVMRFRYTSSDIEHAEDGFLYRARDGARIDIPVDGLMRADGSMATGPVTPSVTPLHVVRTDPFPEIEAFPGVFEGIQADGDLGLLLTYGAAEFVFEQNGQELQLAPGKVATIEIPIYTAGAEVGQMIPLWSVDEKLGQWVQEGEGTVVEAVGSPTGLALRATISHLSWWNCDDFVDESTVVRNIRCVGGDPAAPVDCWVASNDRQDPIDPEDGPLYEVRTFVEAAGRPLIFPGGRNTPVSGITVFENGEVWRGVAVVNPDDGSEETVIQLARTEGGGDTETIAVPANITASIAVVDEVDNYTFEGTAGQRLFMSGIGRVTAGFSLLDPDGNTVGGGSFGLSNRGTTVAELPVDGTYTLRIAGGAFSVGDYYFSINWLGDPLVLPFRSPRELSAGTNFVSAYAVELSSESVVAAYGGGPRMRVNLCTFEDVCVIHSQENLVVAIGEEPGEYLLTLQGIGGAGEYAVRVTEPTDTWAPGANYSFALGARDIAFVELDTPPDEILTAVPSPDNPANFQPYPYGRRDTDGRIVGALWDELGWRWRFSSWNVLPPYFLVLESGRNAPISETYEMGLSIPAVIPLALDARGTATATGEWTVYGQRHLYSVDVTAGSGLEFVTRWLTPGTDSGINLTLADPIGMEVLDDGNDAFGYGDYGPNLSAKAAATGATAAGVWHWSGHLGSYELGVAVVGPSSSIIVEGDQSCGGATTQSLGAALSAVTDGGQVSLCSGTHVQRSSPVVEATGVTFEGDAGGGTELVVEMRQGFGVTARGDLAVRSMHVRSQFTFLGTQILSSRDPIPSLVLEDLSFAPRVEGEPVGTLGGGTVAAAEVRRVTGSGGVDFNIRGSGGSVLIEEADFSSKIEVYCDIGTPQQVTVSNSTFKGADINRCATVEIDSNEIVDETLRLETFDDVLVTGNTFVADQLVRGMMVFGPGNATITGNTVVGRSSLYVGEGTFVVEDNRVELAAPNNDQVWQITHAPSAPPGRISVRNNVVDNAGVGQFSSYYAIVDVQNAELFESVEFYNNSLRTSPQTTAGKPAVRFALRSSTFTGALPVTFVNNVLEGVGGTAISVPTGTTVDSDYNLFFRYGSVYEGGASSTGTNDLVEPVDPENPPPVFVGPLLELDPASPAVDAGAGPGEYPNVPSDDYSGQPRPQGGRYDMGAHEQ